MNGFTPGLLDRLMDTPLHGVASTQARHSIEHLKDSLARDLEALLNTRTGMRMELLENYPECTSSILSYGLIDFAGMSLSSPDDRHSICLSIEQTIARHEPRLREVRVTLEVQQSSINRLSFAITALLVIDATREAVNFDVVLQPSSLHYSISKGRRSAPSGV